jgi:hypothetical protein
MVICITVTLSGQQERFLLLGTPCDRDRTGMAWYKCTQLRDALYYYLRLAVMGLTRRVRPGERPKPRVFQGVVPGNSPLEGHSRQTMSSLLV